MYLKEISSVENALENAMQSFLTRALRRAFLKFDSEAIARERLTYRDAIPHCAPKNHNLLFGLTSCFAIRERQSFVKKKPDPQNKTTSQSYFPYDKDMNKLYRYFS